MPTVSKIESLLLTVTMAALWNVLSASSVFGDEAYFMGLGDLAGGGFYSQALGVSADGSVVVGYSSAQGTEAFRWDKATGMVSLGDIPGGIQFSTANAAAADGSVIVGSGASSSTVQEASRWTAGSGMVGLGFLPGGGSSEALGVSADGSVVVGWSEGSSADKAFRWTAEQGIVSLGNLPGGGTASASAAWDVSANGSVIVGSAEGPSGREAFRWTQATGMVGLGDLPGGAFWSFAHGLSADGMVVVGSGVVSSGYSEAYRWTQTDGMVGLGHLPGGYFSSRALAVSADGSAIVGIDFSDEGPAAFLWDSTSGMRNLEDVLEQVYGLDLTGWALEDAEGISADGLTIAGYGTNPAGYTEGWVAHIPEPGTLRRAGGSPAFTVCLARR